MQLGMMASLGVGAWERMVRRVTQGGPECGVCNVRVAVRIWLVGRGPRCTGSLATVLKRMK